MSRSHLERLLRQCQVPGRAWHRCELLLNGDGATSFLLDGLLYGESAQLEGLPVELALTHLFLLYLLDRVHRSDGMDHPAASQCANIEDTVILLGPSCIACLRILAARAALLVLALRSFKTVFVIVVFDLLVQHGEEFLFVFMLTSADSTIGRG